MQMVCDLCGKTGIRWMGPLTNLTHTECPHCGGRNCQRAECADEEYEDEADEDRGVTMASEPTKWEPSAASIENMLRATAEVQGYNFDEIPLGEIEEARCVAPIALKAAVAADPLLSAAADMRDALITVREFVQDELDNRDCAGGEATDYVNDAKRALEIIDGAIAKAMGEG